MAAVMGLLLGSLAGVGGLLAPAVHAAPGTPFPPCNPYTIFGTVWAKSNNSPVGVPFTWVWVNDTTTVTTNQVAQTNAAGQYQANLACGYKNNDNIQAQAHRATNSTATNTTTVTVSKPGSWLNLSLTWPALSVMLTAAPSAGEAWLHVNFTSKVTGGNGSYANWGWRFGDGTYATSVAPAGANNSYDHVYSVVGTYRASVFVNDTAGDRWQSAPVTITVNPPPTLSTLTANPTFFNLSASTTISAGWSGGTAPYAITYQTGQTGGTVTHSGIAGTSDTLVHTYGKVSGSTGTVVNATVTDAVSKSSTIDPGPTVWVYDVEVHANVHPADVGQTVTFTGSATGGSGTFGYAWRFQDGSATVSGSSPAHIFTVAGTYLVELWANDTGHAPNSVLGTYTLTVHPALVAALAANVTTVDVGQRISFSANASSGGTTPYASYYFDYGDGTNLNTSSAGVSHPYGTAGSYTAQVTLGDAVGMYSRASTAVTVNNDPTVAVTVENQSTAAATHVAYVGETLAYVAAVTSGGTAPFQYFFVFGDGNTAGYQSGTSTTHAYAATGTYSVVVDVKDAGNGYGTSTTWTVSVYAALTQVSLLSNRTAGMISLAVALTETVSGGVPWYHFNWTFGDGSPVLASAGSSTSDLQNHVYTSSANLTVIVVVADEQGEHLVATLHIFVYPTIVITIQATRPSGNFDPPLNVSYTAWIRGGSGNFPTTSWNLGDGNTSALLSPATETYWHAGSYRTTLAVVDNASDHMGAAYAFTVTGTNATYALSAGWNLIALPGTTTNYDLWFLWQDLRLGGANPATTAVTIQNTAGGTPLNYTFANGVGPGANAGLTIGDARGIWVDVAAAQALGLAATPTVGPLGAPTSLLAGWNTLGWVLSTATTASGMASLLPSATSISVWDAATQSYTTYLPGFDSPGGAYDFALTQGRGVLVWVPAATSFTE